jgi:hypothetical protein
VAPFRFRISTLMLVVAVLALLLSMGRWALLFGMYLIAFAILPLLLTIYVVRDRASTKRYTALEAVTLFAAYLAALSPIGVLILSFFAFMSCLVLSR